MSPAAPSISPRSGSIRWSPRERLQVREVQRRAGAPGDLDQLADRLQQSLALVADVRDERHAERRGLLGHRHELVGLGVGARDVDEPEREHPGARLEPEPHQAAHLGQLRGRRSHPVGAEHCLPHRAVPDRRHEAHGRPAAIERLQVLGERRPGPLGRPLTLERAQVRLARRLPSRRDRSRRQPVGVDHLRREALQDLRRVQRVREGHERRVGVQVDEAPGRGSLRHRRRPPLPRQPRDPRLPRSARRGHPRPRAPARPRPGRRSRPAGAGRS